MKLSLAFVLAATAAAAPTWDWLPGFGKDLGLDQLAQLRGNRFVGTATDVWIQKQDKPYEQIASSKEFGQVTPENTMKWEVVEPQPGIFNFTAADELVAWAHKNKKQVRGHTLVWHSQLAPWVEASNFTAPELKKVLKRHVQTVARHFRGRLSYWDVVNEVFNEDGTFRESIFYKTFGEDFIKWSFQWAKEADPFAKLYINDYNFEGISPKTDAVTKLVGKLKKERVPIDGIGAQGHLILGQVPETIGKLFKIWSDDLKVDVAVTELDVRMPLPATPEKLAQQAKDYKTVFDACLDARRCKGITIWQFTDKYSWVPDVFQGEGDALPWDMELKKKPAYQAMVDSLKRR